MGWTVVFLSVLLVMQWLALSNQARVIEDLNKQAGKLEKELDELIKDSHINLDKQNIICYNCINGYKKVNF